jgi:predicted amidohydrolase
LALPVVAGQRHISNSKRACITVTDRLRIALAQLNPKVGDLVGNLALGRQAMADAVAADADVLLFSELFLTGYFPEDLLFKPKFVDDAMNAALDLVAETAANDVVLVLPTIWQDKDALYNAVLVAEKGEVIATRVKHELPNTDVFFEQRHFKAGGLPEPVTIKGVSVGIPICEDIWHAPVCAALVERGAELLLCPNGSPYWTNKQRVRYELVRARVAEDRVPLLYLNQVGGQDELVFDGASFGVDPNKGLVFQGKSFANDFIVSDWVRGADGWTCAAGQVTELACSACVTMSARMASRMSCWAFRAASIAPWLRPWPSTRLAPSMSTPSCCPIAIRPRPASRTPRTVRNASACATTSSPSAIRSMPRWSSLRRCSATAQLIWPKKTSNRVCAAWC